jgi:hypothetical protein
MASLIHLELLTDFFDKIGSSRLSQCYKLLVAIAGKSDMARAADVFASIEDDPQRTN